MKISAQVDLNCSPEEAFGWVNEPDRAMRWQKGVSGSEIIKETPEKLGTTFKEVMQENGKSLVIYGALTDYIPNKLISFHLESRIHTVQVSYSVIDKINRSTVVVESVIKWKFPMNIICLIVGFKIKAKILAQTESELSELKMLCEKRTG